MSIEQETYLYAIEERYGNRPPTVDRIRIIKETPGQVMFANRAGLAFNCRRVAAPNEFARTPEDAWNRYFARLGKEKAHHLECVAQVDKRIAAALAARGLA